MSEITVKGIYADAKIFTAAGEEESIERYSLAQIKMISDNLAAEGTVIYKQTGCTEEAGNCA